MCKQGKHQNENILGQLIFSENKVRKFIRRTSRSTLFSSGFNRGDDSTGVLILISSLVPELFMFCYISAQCVESEEKER